MTRLLPFVFAAFLATGATVAHTAETAQTPLIQPAGTLDLSEFLWTNRPIVVFADNPADPRFQQQIAYLRDGEDALRTRDVVVLTDTDPAARSAIRTQLRPRGFMLAIIGKDGGVKLRKPLPWTVREITRSIDKFPLRQQEVEDRRGK